MAAANEKPRVLVLGHSFVRRLREFAAQNHSGGPYDLNLGLSNICSIIFHGIGGRTVDKMIKNDLDKIRSAAPNIVVLELGSNDLCDKDSDPRNNRPFNSRSSRAVTYRIELTIYSSMRSNCSSERTLRRV